MWLMVSKNTARRAVAVVVVVALVLSVFPGVAAAETRMGGSVIVAEGQTVDGLSVVAGSVVVRGTVDGNLEGVAGSVVIESSGTVTGDVSASAGNVHIAGEVQGTVQSGSGSIYLAETGRIGGSLEGGAGSVRIDGEIGGDARIGTDTLTLGESGSVGGDLRYGEDTEFVDEGGSVAGAIAVDSALGGGFDLPSPPAWLFSGYIMAVNLALGAMLLLAVPGFSERVGERVGDDPLRSAGVGLAALVGIPVALVVMAITIIGIPLSIAGAILFGLLAWVALLYGRIAIGTWALAQVDVENRWLALVVGIVGLGVVGQIPIFGGLVDLVTFLLGLGAIALVAVALRRGDDEETPEGEAERAVP